MGILAPSGWLWVGGVCRYCHNDLGAEGARPAFELGGGASVSVLELAEPPQRDAELMGDDLEGEAALET